MNAPPDPTVRPIIDACAGSGGFSSLSRGWYMIGEIDLAGLVREHAELKRLCATLEAIADDLPILPRGELLDTLCAALDRHGVSMHVHEEALLTQMFAHEDAALRDALLDYLHARHVACSVHAQDILTALRPGRADSCPVCAETLGFMLRCFFDDCRSTMVVEKLAILTLAGHRLTRDARALLVEHIATAE